MIVLLALVCDLHADHSGGCLTGLAMLDAGDNTTAAKYFKDEIDLREKEPHCDGCVPVPFANLYVAVADYRSHNYEESKAYLLKMLSMKDEYYSRGYVTIGYCLLLASTTNDITLFNSAISDIKITDEKDRGFIHSCLAHSINKFKVRNTSVIEAQRKLALLEKKP